MLSAMISWLLMIPVLFIVGFFLCIADVVTKLLYIVGLRHLSRRCMFLVSRLTELLLKLWGTKVRVKSAQLKLDTNRPILFVSSHHSSLDICLLVNCLKEHVGYGELSFITRSGLNKWIPAVSFYIRQYCYSLPKRSRSDEPAAITLETRENSLSTFAKRINDERNAVVIFPEGVKHFRKNEHNRSFHRKGLRLLLENMPNAQIVPIGISGTRTFYSTPRCLKSLQHNRPQFNRLLQVEILAVLQSDQTMCNEKTIDLLEEKIHACVDRLHRCAEKQPSIITSLRHKWIP